MNFLYKKKEGFSLVELIVVMAIMAIILSISLVRHDDNNDEEKVKVEAHKMVTEIRKTQIKALGSVEYISDTPAGGWGIHINLNEHNDRFIVFANTNYNNGSNLQYDVGEGNKANGGGNVYLSNGVKIASTSVGNILDITFVPPDPTVYIYNGSSTTTSVTISLKCGNITKKVYVNYFGLIDTIK